MFVDGGDGVSFSRIYEEVYSTIICDPPGKKDGPGSNFQISVFDRFCNLQVHATRSQKLKRFRKKSYLLVAELWPFLYHDKVPYTIPHFQGILPGIRRNSLSPADPPFSLVHHILCTMETEFKKPESLWIPANRLLTNVRDATLISLVKKTRKIEHLDGI